MRAAAQLFLRLQYMQDDERAYSPAVRVREGDEHGAAGEGCEIEHGAVLRRQREWWSRSIEARIIGSWQRIDVFRLTRGRACLLHACCGGHDEQHTGESERSER